VGSRPEIDEFVLMKCETQRFNIRLTKRNTLDTWASFVPSNSLLGIQLRLSNKKFPLTKTHFTATVPFPPPSPIPVGRFSVNLKQPLLTS
jgi:hypothetical protein